MFGTVRYGFYTHYLVHGTVDLKIEYVKAILVCKALWLGLNASMGIISCRGELVWLRIELALRLYEEGIASLGQARRIASSRNGTT